MNQLNYQMDFFGVPDFPPPIKPKRTIVRRSRKLEQRQALARQFELMLEVLNEPEEGEIITWSDADIDDLYEYVFERTMEQLLDHRARENSCREIWEWILSPDIHPFSFLVCLSAVAHRTGHTIDDYQIVDPDEIRSSLFFACKRKNNWCDFCLIV